jgi:4-alpha-glucanotransferase
MNKRGSGILLPIASLPSKYGIGSFSKSAYQFVDFLERSGQKYWQILPIGPTSYGDSPYQSFSTFAGNPYFIDPDQLIEKGLLTAEECEEYDFGNDFRYVDYEKIYLSRFDMLRKAYERSSFLTEEAYLSFRKENISWLEDYALYMAIKDSYGGLSWANWDEDIKLRKLQAMEACQKKLEKDILFYEFIQYQFHSQWEALKSYANSKGIRIIGDLPIYVAFDSADTWSRPELFQLDEKQNPIAVAGCPPDAFSLTGQLWGNPLYRWEAHTATGYSWWLERISYSLKLYDVVRIDHFKGFDEYYSIPYGDETAVNGHWEKGPGYHFFQTLKEQLGEADIIAEDLGYITQSLRDLLKKTGYPGMKVLQFAFDSREESDYLPHNYDKNCIVYTGTHDNDTIVGWLKSINQADYDLARRYLNRKGKDMEEIHWDFIRLAQQSVAKLCIIPIQDYLGLDSEARINIPSTVGNNWKWRVSSDVLTNDLAEKIKEITLLYGR